MSREYCWRESLPRDVTHAGEPGIDYHDTALAREWLCECPTCLFKLSQSERCDDDVT
jgi:hypothetical protein